MCTQIEALMRSLIRINYEVAAQPGSYEDGQVFVVTIAGQRDLTRDASAVMV